MNIFKQVLSELGNIPRPRNTFARQLADKIEVPYLEDREVERLLGHRLRETAREEAIEQGLLPTRRFRAPDGSILDTNEFPDDMSYEQLTDEVWTRDNFPTSNNSILEALQKVPHGILAMYYHFVTLNLVLVAPDGELVGIRRTAFYNQNEIGLLSRLKKATTV